MTEVIEFKKDVEVPSLVGPKELSKEEIQIEKTFLRVEYGPDDNTCVCDWCKKPTNEFVECEGVCERVIEEYHEENTSEYTERCLFCSECSKEFQRSADNKWVCKTCSSSLLLPRCKNKECRKVIVDIYPGIESSFLCVCGETELESL